LGTTSSALVVSVDDLLTYRAQHASRQLSLPSAAGSEWR